MVEGERVFYVETNEIIIKKQTFLKYVWVFIFKNFLNLNEIKFYIFNRAKFFHKIFKDIF